VIKTFRKILRRKFPVRRRRKRSRTQKERAHYELHKETARTIVHERIAYWCTVLPVTPNRIAIKDQSTRWGSCSTKGNLNFNYRLALIPIELVDYVVVHELCHLIEFNHSPRFWERVAEHLPDYALRKATLHEYTKLLASHGGEVVPSHLTHVYSQVS
jgi:predicted metal-dependent hydrolase